MSRTSARAHRAGRQIGRRGAKPANRDGCEMCKISTASIAWWSKPFGKGTCAPVASVQGLASLPAARARRAVSSVGARRHDPGDLCTAVSCTKPMLPIFTLPPVLDLHERGVQVQILTGKLAGTYSPVGEGMFFFTMMGAFAELERDIPLERTMAGLAAARGHGRAGGRSTVMDADKLAAAHARRTNG
jgi:hypothetical protein